MRPELELLAKIDAYIDNLLTNEDRLSFEEELLTNYNLKVALQQQIELREGLKYIGLKAKINHAYKNYRFRKQLKTWGIIGAISLVIVGSYLLIENDEHLLSNSNSINTETTFNPKKGFEVGSRLPVEQFIISTASDTVIETTNGTVIAIPANAFASDEPTVQFRIKEAITSEDIVKNGLSTFSNREELETAGMFHFEVMDSKGETNINEGKKLMVDVPTTHKKTDMMIYDGELDSTKNINWIKPKELENYLTTVDIFSLNFYPPKYEEMLSKLGYGNKSKNFKDSLFYSFFCEEEVNSEMFQQKKIESVIYNSDSVSTSNHNIFYHPTHCDGIMPSDIRTIWKKQFQNTSIATKEFEERLQFLYSTCDVNYFKAYLKGMKYPLYFIDSVLATHSTGAIKTKFLEFASRKDGRVKIDDKTVELLNAYYQKKSNLYAKAAEQTHTNYWSKELQKDQTANDKARTQQNNDQSRRWKNYNDELKKNLYSMFEQAGLPKPTIRTTNSGTVYVSDRPIVSTDIIPVEKYSFSVSTTGWKNIDRITSDATARRKSVEVVNDDGKKAILSYSTLNISIDKEDQYDYTMVYLTSPTLTSYFKLNKQENLYSYQINDSLHYNMIIIGYKNQQAFIAKDTNIKKGDLNFTLNPITENELGSIINSACLNQAPKDIQKDIAYKQFVIKDNIRKAKNMKMKQVRNILRPIIFPCISQTDASIVIEKETMDDDF